MTVGRRAVLGGLVVAAMRGGAAALGGVRPLPCLSLAGALVGVGAGKVAALPATRVIRLRHMDAGESIEAAFMVDGEYDVDALARLWIFLRDRRANEVAPIDVMLFQRLWWLQASLDLQAPIQLLSGYRTERTNDMLRSHYEGVARRSLHIQGTAADVRFPGVSPELLGRLSILLADAMGSGGVGFYGWGCHVDCGPKRAWRG